MEENAFGKILSEKDIEKLLKSSKTVAVVGISKNKENPSYFVSEYLKSVGFKLYLVNPKYAGEKILDEVVYGNLSEITDFLDIIDVFRRPEDTVEVFEDALKIKFGTFWFQLETSFEKTTEKLLKKGHDVVLEKCIMVECQKFL